MKKLILIFSALILMSACSSQNPVPAAVEKPQPKGPELVTARTAVQKLYITARGWARDAQPYRVESQTTSESKGQEGKSAIWQAGFASAAQHGVKPYTWSGSAAPDAPSRGVNPGLEDSYSPTNSSTQVFDIAFLKIDSDKALEVAQKHGGDKAIAKNPDLSIFYILDWNRSTNELIWHVIYGPTRDQYKLRLAINATTGEFMRDEK